MVDSNQKTNDIIYQSVVRLQSEVGDIKAEISRYVKSVNEILEIQTKLLERSTKSDNEMIFGREQQKVMIESFEHLKEVMTDIGKRLEIHLVTNGTLQKEHCKTLESITGIVSQHTDKIVMIEEQIRILPTIKKLIIGAVAFLMTTGLWQLSMWLLDMYKSHPGK